MTVIARLKKMLTRRGVRVKEMRQTYLADADADGGEARTLRALSDERVQLHAAGQVELKLKTSWRDGTTHLVMSPLEFVQRLAAGATRPPQLGSAAQAGVRHRHAHLPELRRRGAEDHRGHP